MDLPGIKQVHLIDFTVSDIFYNTFHLILHRGEQIFKQDLWLDSLTKSL